MELRLLLEFGGDLPLALHAFFALLLTYCAHAALWALAGALLARGAARAASVRHLCWKVALFAPLLSAPLSVAFPGGLERALRGEAYVRELPLRVADAAPAHEPPAEAFSERDSAPRMKPLARPGRGRLGAACAVLLLSSGFWRFTLSAWLLRKRLRERQPLRDARLLARFEALRLRLGLPPIALSESGDVDSPLLIGNSEICLPTGLCGRLNPSELDCVFAHELAHIERRDGLWFPFAGFVQAVLWIQPLTRWVGAEFRRSAEFACDDRAVELTSDALGLARALVRVASETSAARQVTLFPAMARSRSGLVPRVRRLTAARRELPAGDRGRRRVAVFLVAIGVSVVSLSVELARAGVPIAPVANRVPVTAAAPSSTALDLTAQNERMDALAREARGIEAKLAAAERGADAQRPGSATAVRVLELTQALSHARASQAWLEQQFVREWAERDGPDRESAVRGHTSRDQGPREPAAAERAGLLR